VIWRTAPLRVFQRWGRLAAFGLLIVALPSAALAHAGLIGSQPPNDAVLPVAPQTLTLSFNEPVEPLVMQIIDGSGVVAAITRIDRSGPSLILTPPAVLNSGAHILSWRVRSEDGHPVGGSLTFFVGVRDAARPEFANTANRPLAVAIWVARLLIYMGLFVGVGGAFFQAWIGVAARRQPSSAATKATMIVALVALVVSIGLQGLDALAALWPALMSPSTWITGAQGSFGIAAVMAAVALCLGLLSLRHDAARARIVSVGAMITVGLALAASGHAANADPRMLAITAVFLHAVSLAFWIGALLPLAVLLRTSGSEAIIPLQRFSRAIPFAIAALLASGALLAVVQLQSVNALWSTDYGRLLAIKLALVAMLLAFALLNRIVLTSRVTAGSQAALGAMRRSILSELALVAIILGVVGLWRFTPPPRLLPSNDDSFFTHIHTEKLMANVTISPVRAGAVDIVVQLEMPDERPLIAKALTVSLANPGLGIEPLQVEALVTKDGDWHAHVAAPVAGRWSLGLGVLISDFDRLNVEAPILIK
jgi:copper transport protein